MPAAASGRLTLLQLAAIALPHRVMSRVSSILFREDVRFHVEVMREERQREQRWERCCELRRSI